MNIKFKKGERGLFTDLFERLYVDLRTNPFPCELKGYPMELKSFLDRVYEANNQKLKLVNNIELPNIDIEKTNEVLVAFSGGKDSLAVVLELMRKGYTPKLYHMKGINRSYPHELDFSRELATKLNLELVEVDISIIGKCEYKEHPLKNFFILSNMVDYGLKKNITKYAFGNLSTDSICSQNINYSLSDSIELFDDVEKFYKNYIENFEIIKTLESVTHAYQITTRRMDLVDSISSCILPKMYKERVRMSNIKKFGENVEFYKGRCGSCNKCATEYIHYVLMGIIKKDEDYFKHAMKVLRKSINQVDISFKGDIKNEIDVLSVYVSKDLLK